MNYYFILATQKFLFEKEPLEEVLREKNQYYLCLYFTISEWIVYPNNLHQNSFRSHLL